ncbi:conserved hypothetical protein [Ricinus communis]|uniref:SnoaL-like domain-containing protein n=1 Tax=Ricinus communis TaxID=3988 RepID=B9TB29_RICCO|nr:conserved hypothetical protein [Ricinus communis]
MSAAEQVSASDEKEAIREVLYGYCYGTDGGDTELWVEGFTEDCVWDGGAFGMLKGKDAMREFHRASGEGSKALRHLTLNSVIDLDGDTAHVVSYVAVVAQGQPAAIYFLGHYDDQFVKVDGQWRIKSRKVRADLADIDAPKVRA